MSEQTLKAPPRCRDCGEPCIDAGPGLGWQCVRPNCYEEHHGPIHTREDLELTRLRSRLETIERAAREVLQYTRHKAACSSRVVMKDGAYSCNCGFEAADKAIRSALALGEKVDK